MLSVISKTANNQREVFQWSFCIAAFPRRYSANKDLRLVPATTPRPSFPTSSLPLLSTQHQPQWSVLTRAFHMRNGAYMRSGNCLQARVFPRLLTQPTEAFQPHQGDKTRAPTKLL